MDKTTIRPQHIAALGAELARLRRRVDELAQRLDQAPASAAPAEAGLTARIDDLTRQLAQASEDAAGARARQAGIESQVTALRSALDGQRRELTALADRLGARLAEPKATAAVAPSAAIDDLRQDLDQASAQRQGLAQRIEHVEGRLAGAEMMLAAAADVSLGDLDAELTDLDRKIEGLEQALDAAGTDARLGMEADRLATNERLGRLRARLGVGLTLIALLAGGLAATQWWWTQGQMAEIDRRIAAREARPATRAARDLQAALAPLTAAIEELQAREAERQAAQPTVGGDPDALLARIAALEQAQNEPRERPSADALDPRLEALDQTQAELGRHTSEVSAHLARLVERLDRLEAQQAEGPPQVQDLAEALGLASERLAALEVRVGALARAEADQPTPPGPSAEPPPESEPRGEEGLPPPIPLLEPEPEPEVDGAEATEPPAAAPRVLAEERYVIQLIGFRSPSSLAPFVQRLGIVESARYLRTRVRGQAWYEVVMGEYATAAEAQAAVAAMPPEIQALGPWVRSLPAGTELRPIE